MLVGGSHILNRLIRRSAQQGEEELRFRVEFPA
jgi:hypothetical protein